MIFNNFDKAGDLMFKLLLVDDFFVERENAKEIIEESGLEIEVIGEVSNGQEALEAIEKEMPDFILTDIEMPFMNGFDLAVRVKECYPQIKVIFFSFYNKFEYAKKAIDLEVYAYILKPIIKDEMVVSLEKIISEKKQELKKQKEDFELKEMLNQSRPLLLDKFKRDLFMGIYRLQDIRERIEFFQLSMMRNEQYLVLVIEVDEYHHKIGTQSLEKREMVSIQMSKYIEREMSSYENGLWTKVDEPHWAILLSNPAMGIEFREHGYTIAEIMINCMLMHELSVSIGVSSVFYDLSKANEMYEQALHALSFKFNLGKGQIIDSEDIQGGTEEPKMELNVIGNELVHMINSGDERLAAVFVDGLFSRFDKKASGNTIKNLCFSVMICAQMTLNDLNTSLDAIFGREQIIWEKLLKFETILDVKQWLKDTLIAVVHYIKNKHNSQSRRIIEDAKEFIIKNYSKSITIKSIADDLYYNANYLNNVFKQETGETILEYITKVRVDVAKKLLQEPGRKMYEISEAVGYSHESYFRNIFKQHTGLNPKEYRDKAR